MAKVGNEAKLILRLAEEWMQVCKVNEQRNERTGTYSDGFTQGVEAYAQHLWDIVSELEGK